MSNTRIGTACFEDIQAAIKYYKEHGYTRQDVKDKILCKEIIIGKPLLREGESLGVDSDGRYWISEPAQIVPIAKGNSIGLMTERETIGV